MDVEEVVCWDSFIKQSYSVPTTVLYRSIVFESTLGWLLNHIKLV